MKEIWKPIPKYPNYQVSNLGRIRSKYSDKILKLTITKYGYVTVILYKNKKAYYNRVHRLVALAFIPNPEKLPIINHKDENKTNNNVNNLEWCDYKYNNNYGVLSNRRYNKMVKGISNCSTNIKVIL